MAKVKAAPLMAQADLNQLNPQDQMDLEDQIFQMQQSPQEQTDIQGLVDSNGVPNNNQSSTSLMQKYLQTLQSPDYQKKLKELSDRSKQAIEEQRSGLQQNEALANQLEPKAQSMNLAPALQLADAWTGSNLSHGYVTPDQYKEKLLSLRNQIQSQRKGLTDEELALLKSQTSGDMSPLKGLKDVAAIEAFGGKSQQSLLDRQNQRMDKQEHLNLLKEVDQDQTQKLRVAAYSTIDNAMNNFFNAKNPQLGQLKEMEQAIASSLNIKGTGGVDERDARYLHTLAGEVQKANQFWHSLKGTDLEKNKSMRPVIEHLKNVAQLGLGNFQRNAQTRYNALIAGHEDMYQRHPEWKQDLDKKLKASIEQFKQTAVAPKKEKLQKQEPVSQGPSVDANLDNMSPEELQQWISTHGQ